MSISKDSLVQRGGMLVYPWYISDLTSSIDFKKEFGLGVEEVFITNKESFLQAYYDVESADSIGKFFLNKVITDKLFYTLVVENIYKKSEELEKFCQVVDSVENIESLSSEEVVRFYEDYVLKLRALRLWGWVPVFIDGFNVSFLSNYIVATFTDFLKSRGLESRVAETYSILSSCEKVSEVGKEKIERLRMLDEISNSSDSAEIFSYLLAEKLDDLRKKYPHIYAKLENHRKSFEWLTYAYSGPVMSLEYLVRVMKDDLVNKKTISEQFVDVVNYSQNLKAEKDKLSVELGLTDDLKYLFDVSSEMMYMKDWRKGVYQKSYVVMDKVISELARRMGLTMTQIKYLVVEEIKKALSSSDSLDKFTKKALAREKICCYHIKNEKMTIFEGEDCFKKMSEILGTEEKAANNIDDKKADKTLIIKGMVAYRGKVTGRVKIVLSVSDMEKVNEGDILVSSATNPDLIVAMGKAGAFVTDMGGITSHAAIVSREMKKPCVVGTKIATQILKDGDLVEVDADKGIVRIIK